MKPFLHILSNNTRSIQLHGIFQFIICAEVYVAFYITRSIANLILWLVKETESRSAIYSSKKKVLSSVVFFSCIELILHAHFFNWWTQRKKNQLNSTTLVTLPVPVETFNFYLVFEYDLKPKRQPLLWSNLYH